MQPGRPRLVGSPPAFFPTVFGGVHTNIIESAQASRLHEHG